MRDSRSVLQIRLSETGRRGTTGGAPEAGQAVVVTNVEFTDDLDQSSFHGKVGVKSWLKWVRKRM